METTMKQKRLKSFCLLGVLSVLLAALTGCPKLPHNPTPPPRN